MGKWGGWRVFFSFTEAVLSQLNWLASGSRLDTEIMVYRTLFKFLAEHSDYHFPLQILLNYYLPTCTLVVSATTWLG